MEMFSEKKKHFMPFSCAYISPTGDERLWIHFSQELSKTKRNEYDMVGKIRLII